VPVVLSAPGAVIATSNNADLWAATAVTLRIRRIWSSCPGLELGRLVEIRECAPQCQFLAIGEQMAEDLRGDLDVGTVPLGCRAEMTVRTSQVGWCG
jgi:hypothetical protein